MKSMVLWWFHFSADRLAQELNKEEPSAVPDCRRLFTATALTDQEAGEESDPASNSYKRIDKTKYEKETRESSAPLEVGFEEERCGQPYERDCRRTAVCGVRTGCGYQRRARSPRQSESWGH
jgi:hypothetical protein